MSRDFYKYIATRIVEYFKQENENIHSGDRFRLKLDNLDMVAEVNKALIEETSSHSIQGMFVLSDTYKTYTIKLSGKEIVVAAQIEDMTNDFFATLRNLTLDVNPNPILMISCSPIDTITNATRDMAAKGMPFHTDTLIETIERDIKNSSSLSSDDVCLLLYELNRVKRDRFADTKSLFEYKSFLSSLRRGKVEKEGWIDFRLLPDDFSAVPDNKRSERISNNHDDFETIDHAFRYGNIRDALGGEYDGSLIGELETKKRNGNQWYESLDYAKLLQSKAKKERKQSNPLNIENEDISAYYDMPMLYSFDIDEKMFIRNAGESKAKQRDKNILIYNPDKKDRIDLRITTNVALKKDGVIRKDTDNTSVDINHKEYVFHIITSGCAFSQVELHDGENNIRYKFRICIVDIAPTFLKNIQTCYRVDGSGKKRRIVIEGVKGQLIINPGQNGSITQDLKEQGVYACTYDQTLRLDIDEESISPDSGKLNFIISFGTLDIPFTLSDDIVKPTELTGIKAFKLKNAQKRGLEYCGENRVDLGTVRYYVRGAFEEDLRKEAFIIENSAAYIELDDEGIHKKDIEICEDVRSAYNNMISLIRSRNQLPSLTFYDEKVIEVATCYVNAVRDFFSSIEQGKILTGIHNNTLLLGLVYDRTTNTIALSPLHPLNVIYQLELVTQTNIDKVRDDIVERLTSANLLPYIKHFDSRELYEVVEQRNSPEWHYYAPMDNKRFKGARDYVPKLVKEKIEEYHAHFKFLFGDIGSNRMKISLHNLGDCKEILHGIILYYRKQLKDNNMLPEELLGFDIDIYGKNDTVSSTDFSILSNLKRVKTYLDNMDTKSEFNSDLAAILVSKIHTYIHKPNETSYKYSHIAFYEMISSEDCGDSLISGLTTGASLDGIVSGIPSVYSEGWYKTGFGTNYATNSELIKFASLLNSLYRVAFSSSTYTEDHCITTEISKGSSDQLEKVYSSANWIVFVDPKVDLSFFYQDDSSKNLLIIHYGDQNSSASGYNAITVTRKSEQYENIIAQELNKNGIAATPQSAKKIIDFFNAINGRWLLRLISSKKALESNFSREKMSIISAIKFAMAYYSHKDIVWIPLSLEEILRVSRNTGLSQDGLLSAKNLGFVQGATCDDLLLIGIEHGTGKLKVHIHPIEVKIGNNSNAILDKAQKQLSNTYRGFMDALWPECDERYSIERKVVRNFVMQLAILSCEKMKLYGIYPEEEWNIILDKHRCDLLNENYTISDELNKYIGIGTVVSFKQDEVLISGSRNEENDIVLTHLPEKEGYDYLVKSIAEIETEVKEAKYLPPKLPVQLNDVTSETIFEQQVIVHRDALKDILPGNDNEEVMEEISEAETIDETEEIIEENDIHSITVESTTEASTDVVAGSEMCVLFGHDQSNGQPLYWHPGNTDEVFHTNTGIIGTMGTGKTQFTQSLVTQLYRERVNNVGEPNIGILIFDYKGDYNESKENFVKVTNAIVLKPYHLPYNPLALTIPRVFKPLLPIHVANAFNDTLSRVYHLGPKQSSSLLNCIKEAYAQKGINQADPSSWTLTAPTFHDVFRIYMDNEGIKKNDSLEAALSKLNDFEVFESDPTKTKSLFDLLNGVVVVDISGYDSDIQNLIIAITLDLFYAQMQAMGSSKLSGKHRQLTKMILVDEADNFLHEGFPSLKKILKEGREFGIGTILSTQFLKHFGSGEDDFSKYILTWVVHNVADLKNTDIRFVFNTEPNSALENKLFNDVKKLQKHHSIVKIGNNPTPIYIKDKAFWQLYNEIKD